MFTMGLFASVNGNLSQSL